MSYEELDHVVKGIVKRRQAIYVANEGGYKCKSPGGTVLGIFGSEAEAIAKRLQGRDDQVWAGR
jgi:hypothetical protein